MKKHAKYTKPKQSLIHIDVVGIELGIPAALIKQVWSIVIHGDGALQWVSEKKMMQYNY